MDFWSTKSSKSSHLPFLDIIEAIMFVCIAQAHWYAKISSRKLHGLTLSFCRRGQRWNRHPWIFARPLNTDSLHYGVRDHLTEDVRLCHAIRLVTGDPFVFWYFKYVLSVALISFFYSLSFGPIYYTNISACASLDDSQAADLLYCSWFCRRSASLTYLLDRVPFPFLFVDQLTSASASTSSTVLVFGTWETDSGGFFRYSKRATYLSLTWWVQLQKGFA